jgi:transposase-like protein
VSILKEHDAGATFVELGRRHGVHPNTVAAWKAKYGGMESSEIARNRAVDDENTAREGREHQGDSGTLRSPRRCARSGDKAP